MSVRHVAIVGAGAWGSFQALHLLGVGAVRITLIEREREPGRGTAYGTKRPEHLLNVPARRMIVWPDDPDDFARWFSARGGSAEGFAERRQFGDYLCEQMTQAGGAIEVARGEAVAVETADGGEQVSLADGRTVAADAVVLGMGNLRPAAVRGIHPVKLGDLYIEDPWYGGFTNELGDDDEVLLIGTGLTAIDAALTLDATGFRGRITALSRRGLAPRANLRREPVANPLRDFPRRTVELLRTVRRRAHDIGWREAVHELRPITHEVWGGLPFEEKRRFIRHLRPWWDVHRHRIAPAVAERIETMQAEGRLGFFAGRILSAEPEDHHAMVAWRPRGAEAAERLKVRRIVSCSGPELDISRAGEPLLDSLLAAGRIRPDPCRLGIDVDTECRVIGADGEASATLSAIGPMTRGAFWESIAVSDIAAQARKVARRLRNA